MVQLCLAFCSDKYAVIIALYISFYIFANMLLGLEMGLLGQRENAYVLTNIYVFLNSSSQESN